MEALVEELASIVIIKVKNAGGFPAMDMNGKADPFVNIRFGTKKFQTKTIKKTLNPVWDQTFQLFVDLNEVKFDFEFELWDWDSVSTNDLIGTGRLNFSNITALTSLNQPIPETILELEPSKNVKKKNKTPFLTLEIARFDELAVTTIFWNGLLEWFDTNGNGTINQAEYLSLLYGIEAPIVNNADEMDALFRQMDKNGDGELSIEEIVDYFHNMARDRKELAAKVWPKAQYMWFVVLRAIQASSSIGNIIMDPHFQINNDEVKYSDQSKKSDDLIIFNRETGKLEIEKIPNYIRISLRLMYGVGKNVTSNKKIRKILATMTHKQGATYSDPKSVAQIKPFIAFHGLNMEEAVISDPSQYVHFNDFFYRKLKASARLIAGAGDEKAVLTPADCRLLVFPTISASTEIWIKAENFNLENLLGSASDAKLFDGGSLVICRLAPQDYHRFHMPVDGTFNEFREVPGSYFTVNPVAINSTVDVYSTNHRLITLIDNPRYGKVAFIAVGATLVGSIEMTIKPGDKLNKGDEVGYFAFGGSTVLLLFPPGAVTFDADLLVNSAKPLETLVKMGNHIGTFN